MPVVSIVLVHEEVALEAELVLAHEEVVLMLIVLRDIDILCDIGIGENILHVVVVVVVSLASK